MKVILIEPAKQPQTIDIEPTLEAKQKMVGGPIDVLEFTDDNDAIIVVNDEGRNIGMPFNRSINNHHIYGTFLICGYDEDGNMLELSPHLLQKYTELFSFPENIIDIRKYMS